MFNPSAFANDAPGICPTQPASANEPTPLAGHMRAKLGVIFPNEAAEVLGVTERTLGQWRYEGRGPDFVKAGNLIFYRLQDLADWLALNVVVTRRTG